MYPKTRTEKDIPKGSDFNTKQIELLCHPYNGMVDEGLSLWVRGGYRVKYSDRERSEFHYLMAERAMYPTREKGEPYIGVFRLFAQLTGHCSVSLKISPKSKTKGGKGVLQICIGHAQ